MRLFLLIRDLFDMRKAECRGEAWAWRELRAMARRAETREAEPNPKWQEVYE